MTILSALPNWELRNISSESLSAEISIDPVQEQNINTGAAEFINVSAVIHSGSNDCKCVCGVNTYSMNNQRLLA